MKRAKRSRSEHGLRSIQRLASFLLLVLGGCGVSDSAVGGGSGGSGGDAALIRDSSTEDSFVAHDPRWDLPQEELVHAIAPVSNATACTSGALCPTGYCVDGFCCDSKCDNNCMACSAAKKGSGVDGICGSIAFDTDPENDCPHGACDGRNMCKNYNGFSCTASAQCLSNYCVDGFCCNNICMGSCQACSSAKKGSGQDGLCGAIKAATDPDNECSNADCNGSGVCTTIPQPTFPNGTACTSAAQCASGYCADGVCCESWCLGTCQACTAAKKNQGTDGTCGPIANDKDPDEECWGGACNGAGVCKQYNGVPCTGKSQCLSNYCVDGFCCGNICTGWCYACSEARKGSGYDGACGPILSGRDADNECSPGECNGSGACNQPQTPLVNGLICIASAQCASGNCVDGYCCDTACNETCKACSAAKKGSGANGTCGNIIAEADPDSECGYGGRCGGNGTCRYYNGLPCTSTSQCFSNYCADGVCCGNICNQTCYACSAAKKGQGVDGACGPIAGTKDPDNECNLGECNGTGTCNQPQSLQPNGAACTSAPQCISGNCIDGVCCDTACTGACQACSATKKGQGTSGTCGPIKYDTDPDVECYSGACSGSGACQYYNGVACTAAMQCLSTYCVDGVCCGNHCGGTCYACTAAKKGSGFDGTCGVIINDTDPDDECALTCNGSGGCVQAPNGSTCSTGAECISGFCADGGCCNSACTESCRSCNLPGNVGTCFENSPNACSNCQGTIGFPTMPLVPAGTWATAISADVNGDGKADVIGAVSGASSVDVMLGNGNSTFGAKTTYPVTGNPWKMKAVDLNGDGAKDIVALTDSAPVSTLMNNGDGTFAPQVDNISLGLYPVSIASADFNNDGQVDLAFGGLNLNTMSIVLNTGNGTFAPGVVYPTGPYLSQVTVAAGDLNGDGLIDIACANSGRDYVSLIYNQGNGVFAQYVEYQEASALTGIDVVDVDANGMMDIVSTSGGYVRVRNRGVDGWAPPQSYAVDPGNTISLLSTQDLNADGRADVIAAGYDSRIYVLLGGWFSLSPAVRYRSPSAMANLMVGDFSGDGKVDIATSLEYRPLLAQYRGRGDGTFVMQTEYPPLVGSITGIVADDFSGDGRIDFAMPYGGNAVNPNGNPVDDGSSRVAIIYSQINGTYGAKNTFTTGWQPVAIAAADLNADGRADLVTANYRANAVSVLRKLSGGTGFATFVNYPTLPGPTALALGDVSGDGNKDVIVANRDNNTVSVYYNSGIATLINRYDHSAGSGPIAVTTADVNGDGKLDIITTNSGTNTANVIMNMGNGVYAPFVAYPAGTGVGQIFAADINADGKTDLVIGHGSNNASASVLYNQGDGTFGTKVDHAFDAASAITVADLNGDGRTDIAAAGYLLQVLFNQGNGNFTTLSYPPAHGGGLLTAHLNNDARLDLANGQIAIMHNTCMP